MANKISVVNLTSINPLDVLTGLQKKLAIALIRYNDHYCIAGKDLNLIGENLEKVESVNVYPLSCYLNPYAMDVAISEMETLGFVLFK